MDKPDQISRRTFLTQTSGALGSGWLANQWPIFLAAATVACSRRDSAQGFKNLDEGAARVLEAVAEQIIPADDSPGARQAGVIWFIDELLGGAWSGARSGLEAGAADLDQRAGSTMGFVDLPPEGQATILRNIEKDRFFGTMRMLTLAGMFAMPALGGNREKAGWALIGFEDRHSWQPPFGYYDAQVAELEGDA